MNRLYFVFFIVTACKFASYSQGKYLVYFTDKSGTPFTIDKPTEFLSEKSIQRRQKQNITIKGYDLPPSPKYVDSLKKLGFKVWYTSRWFNAAYVYAPDSNLVKYIAPNLSFVNKIQILKTGADAEDTPSSNLRKQRNAKMQVENNDYGASLNQNEQICANEMHKQGYRGEGIDIAVFDGGFSRANQVFFLADLFNENRLLGTYDFVERKTNVYGFSDHGTNVLSCMAGYAKGSLIGTAYKANYYLFRTEDGATEWPIEEANWLIAAEKADSLGVDIINSSLGYTYFDDRNLSYSYQDRDGRKPISSRAATFAARVGMIVVASAGNGGNSSTDPYVSAPADADSILAVGAVNAEGRYVSFSSYGPTIDGRRKPEVMAKGAGVTVGSFTNIIGTANGTSFSSPVMAGMVAGLWQANPTLTNMEIIDLIKKSASLYHNPDNKMGYGIPCFFKAQLLAMGRSQVVINDGVIIPNPVTHEKLMLVIGQEDTGKDYEVEFFDSSGSSIFKQSVQKAQSHTALQIKSSQLTSGLYFVKVSNSSGSRVLKLVKN